jgi:hypoxanthine phosphoribosyltransferase
VRPPEGPRRFDSPRPSADFPVLRSAEEIAADVDRVAGEIRRRAQDRVPILLGILTGGFVFLSDLARAIEAAHEIDFLSVTRYDPKNRDPSAMRVIHDLSLSIQGRLVVVVEGIRTSGPKIEYVDRFLRLHEPEEILYSAMVRQQGAGRGSVPLDSWGFDIDDGQYVVGYGLDLGGRYRSLPYLGIADRRPDAGSSGETGETG